MGAAGRHAGRNRSLARENFVTVLEDVVTYLEMLERPVGRRVMAPLDKLALMRAENCTVSFYRYIYDTVGRPCLARIEVFVIYVRGVPAGFFELDTAQPRETKLCYFGLIPDFIGRRLGPWLLQAAIDQAWTRPLDRLWLHTSTFDHPKALSVYQQAGFVVYDRRRVSFDDPRDSWMLPKSNPH